MKSPAYPLRRLGFTLVEVLLATAILGLLVVMFATILSQTSNLWKRTTGKMEQFRESRIGFEVMTQRLSQATLNTYWDYNDTNIPTRYERRSELRFVSGLGQNLLGSVTDKQRPGHAVFFQAPLGFSNKFGDYENLLCSCGYYLEYGSDKDLRPAFITDKVAPYRYRHRLMEFLAPAENNVIYKYTSGLNPTNRTYKGNEWYKPLVNVAPAANTAPYVHALAENIIALVLTPRLSVEDEKVAKGTGATSDESPLAPLYSFDSSPAAATDARYSNPLLNPTHQLPPILQVTMVAIDETSAIRQNLTASSSDTFGTATKFTKSVDYGKDLFESRDPSSLEATLIKKGVNYRIFNTNVTIRGAKWSREQIK